MSISWLLSGCDGPTELPAKAVEAGRREGGEDLADPLLGGLGRGIDLPRLGLLDRTVRLGPAPLLVLPLPTLAAAALALPLLAGLGIAMTALTMAAAGTLVVAARLLVARRLLPVVAVGTVFPALPRLPRCLGRLGRPGLGAP